MGHVLCFIPNLIFGDLLEGEGALDIGTYFCNKAYTRYQAHTSMLQRVTVCLGQHASLDTARRHGLRKKECRLQKGRYCQKKPLHAYFLISMKVG